MKHQAFGRKTILINDFIVMHSHSFTFLTETWVIRDYSAAAFQINPLPIYQEHKKESRVVVLFENSLQNIFYENISSLNMLIYSWIPLFEWCSN